MPSKKRPLPSVPIGAPASAPSVTVHPITEADARVGRVAARLTIEFFLRTAKIAADLYDGDLIAALVLFAVNTANTRHLDQDPRHAGQFASIDDIPPDEARRPISVLAIANSLGLPYETTRRHVNRLIASGACLKVKGGLIAPQYGPSDAPAILANMTSLRRFHSALERAGVDLGLKPHRSESGESGVL